MTASGAKRAAGWSWLLRLVPIVLGLAVGLAIGTFSRDAGLLLGPFGQLYLSLLLMCVIPIIGAAVVSSLGRMVSTHRLGKNMVVIVAVFWIGMLLASLTGTLIGWATGVGENLEMSPALGDLLLRESTGGPELLDEEGAEERYVELFEGERARRTRSPVVGGADEPRFLLYLEKLVPGNLAEAYHENNYLAVLFFSVLLGVALGFVPGETRGLALGVVEAIFDSLLRIINWIILLLPLGIVCIVAGQVAAGGLEFIGVFRRVVLVSLLTTLVVMALFTLTIWRVTDQTLFGVVKGLREPLLVAFVTSSSFASIPAALVALKENFGLSKESANLFLPLGTTMNPIGSALFFSLSSIFAVQLHANTDRLHDPVNFLFLVVGAVLAGIAAMGLPGASALAMLTLVLEPIGVPAEVGIIALLAVAPIIDPLFTTVNVFGNCTATCILSRYLERAAARAAPEPEPAAEAG